MKKAILYIRVSTDEQANTGFSLRDQKDKLLKYCQSNNIEVLKVFQEDSKVVEMQEGNLSLFLELMQVRLRWLLN
jgi:site-specific DNA recombinase